MREMPKIKKAGGISRFLDAFFYRNNITQNYRSVELTGPTGHHVRPPYTATPEKLPLALQDTTTQSATATSGSAN